MVSFILILNGFLKHENYDVYVTCSNSKMLSKDIIELRGRGGQIHVYQLSFKEYYDAIKLPFDDAYIEYQYFGGMPYLLSLDKENKKIILEKSFY